jgi:ribosomal protein S18 acetylase RimI-like enzyme
MNGTLRLATPEDIPDILRLDQALFDNPFTEPMLKRELEVGHGYVWVGPHILGYALVRQDSRVQDLTRLGVSPTAQGTGVGTLLLKRVLAEGRETVLTVRKTNKGALRLYRRHGFAVVGHFTNAWVLRRAEDRAERPAT